MGVVQVVARTNKWYSSSTFSFVYNITNIYVSLLVMSLKTRKWAFFGRWGENIQ